MAVGVGLCQPVGNKFGGSATPQSMGPRSDAKSANSAGQTQASRSGRIRIFWLAARDYGDQKTECVVLEHSLERVAHEEPSIRTPNLPKPPMLPEYKC